MNPEFKKFLAEERKRFFEPDAWFPKRVMARLGQVSPRTAGVWDFAATAARPVFAIALTVLVALIAFEALVPAIPSRGMIEAFLEPEQSSAEALIYTESDTPASADLLEHVIVLVEEEE